MRERRIKVWDLPTRILHWMLVAMVTAAFITGFTGGDLMEWHGRAGLAILGLLGFRLTWGFVGSSYARFAQFVRGPGTILAYLHGRWQGAGHNPLGALSVLAILGLLLVQASSGLVANDDIAYKGPLQTLVQSGASDWLTQLHRLFAWGVGAVVILHLCAILFYSLVRRESMIRPMLDGHKSVSDLSVPPAIGGGPISLLAALLVAAAVVWAASGGLLPEPPPPSTLPTW